METQYESCVDEFMFRVDVLKVIKLYYRQNYVAPKLYEITED